MRHTEIVATMRLSATSFLLSCDTSVHRISSTIDIAATTPPPQLVLLWLEGISVWKRDYCDRWSDRIRIKIRVMAIRAADDTPPPDYLQSPCHRPPSSLTVHTHWSLKRHGVSLVCSLSCVPPLTANVRIRESPSRQSSPATARTSQRKEVRVSCVAACASMLIDRHRCICCRHRHDSLYR